MIIYSFVFIKLPIVDWIPKITCCIHNQKHAKKFVKVKYIDFCFNQNIPICHINVTIMISKTLRKTKLVVRGLLFFVLPVLFYILGVLTHTTAWDRHLGREKNWSSSQTCLLKLWPCGFKIEYMYFGFPLVAAVWLGSEGNPNCIFFTQDTYQATFICDILLYYCRNSS